MDPILLTVSFSGLSALLGRLHAFASALYEHAPPSPAVFARHCSGSFITGHRASLPIEELRRNCFVSVLFAGFSLFRVLVLFLSAVFVAKRFSFVISLRLSLRFLISLAAFFPSFIVHVYFLVREETRCFSESEDSESVVIVPDVSVFSKSIKLNVQKKFGPAGQPRQTAAECCG